MELPSLVYQLQRITGLWAPSQINHYSFSDYITCNMYLSDSFKEDVTETRDDALQVVIIERAHHGIGLARA